MYETKETGAGFWERVTAAFNAAGIAVSRVLTDNGSCYRPTRSRTPSARRSSTPRNGPYRPQTNGKVRDDCTMFDEWGLRRPPMPQRQSESPTSQPGCITTITPEATPHSRVDHQLATSPTSWGYN